MLFSGSICSAQIDSSGAPTANHAGSAANHTIPATAMSNHNASQVVLCDLLVSMATPSILLAVLGGRLVARSIGVVGQLSEDILRGDRLPVLHFPPR